jgi:uncharacterized protein YcfL
MKKLSMLIAASLLLAAGCSTNSMSELKDPMPAHMAAKPTLDVKVETSGRSATVIVTTDLHISKDHVGMQRVPGEGHIHLYLDGGEKIAVTDNKYVFNDLQPGKHMLRVSLHNNDHTPYDVYKEVEFEIK